MTSSRASGFLRDPRQRPGGDPPPSGPAKMLTTMIRIWGLCCTAGATLVLLGSCGGESGSTREAAGPRASCEDAVVFDGREYFPVADDWSSLGLRAGGEVDGARWKCDGGSAMPRAIDGIPPRLALTAEARIDDRIYVAPGSFVLEPAHPLHDVLASRAPGDVPRAGCRAGTPSTATVADTQLLGFSVRLRLRDRARTLRVDGRTQFRGFGERLAILDRGDRVRVRAASCPDSRKPLLLDLRLLRRRG